MIRARVRQHLETIAVAAVVGALAAGGPAVAGTLVDFAKRAGNADKVDGIDASRTPRAGVLLALDANARFPRSVLPSGARGATGPRGPVGAAGPQGQAGPAGPKGETGAVGPRGATGLQGLQGLPGLHGMNGAPGPQGEKGAPGEAGADGAPGAKGETGSAGPPGAKGDKGDTGATGAKGETGSAGAPGAKGDKGDTGATGAKGETGSAGAPGAKGDKGDTGATGAKGETGSAGAPGAKGDKGETGSAGAAGTPGEKGEKGDPGAAGTPGAAGEKGEKGDKGDKGEKGDDGPAGSAAAYSPIVDINPILRPSGSHLWDRVQLNGSSWFNGYRSSFPTGTSESYLEWKVPLQAGTWTIDVVYVESSDAGIMTLSLGGDDLAPAIDAFRPQVDGIGYNRVATFSGVSVASTGIHTVKIRTASKNSLSSDYFGYLTWIRLVRE